MIEFSGGSLFMKKIDEEPMLLGDNMIGTMEYKLSADAVVPMLCNTKSMDFTFEADHVNLELFDYIFDVPLFSNDFTIEYNVPIMIQARWHKKPRVNKKWLKRYGMKKDRVLARCNVDSFSQDDSNEVNFELSNMRYEFRPDQLRRNLKIDGCEVA